MHQYCVLGIARFGIISSDSFLELNYFIQCFRTELFHVLCFSTCVTVYSPSRILTSTKRLPNTFSSCTTFKLICNGSGIVQKGAFKRSECDHISQDFIYSKLCVSLYKTVLGDIRCTTDWRQTAVQAGANFRLGLCMSSRQI